MKIDLRDTDYWTEAYLPVIWDPNTYNVLWGGAGSGKSQTLIQLFLSEIINQKENQAQTFFVIRKVASTLRNSVFADFQNKINAWGLHKFCRVKSGYLEIHSGTNKIVFLGCDDPEKLKSLSQAKSIWIEEATELSLQDFTQISLRLRGKSAKPKRLYLTFNPVSDSHWIKKRFFDEVPANEKDQILRLHATYLDNLDKLDDSYVQRMQAMKEVNETMYQIYALGEWGVWDREKLFAKDFQPDVHVVNYGFKAAKGLPLYLSFDFNIKNTCIVFQIQKTGPTNQYWAHINVIKTYRMNDLETMCRTIKEEYPGMEYHINGDASGRSGNALTEDNISAYQLLCNYLSVDPEFQLQVPMANPRHESSRLHCSLAFKKCRIQIAKHENKELIEDLKSAKVDKKQSLETWKKENPEMGHALDCFRYFVSTNCYEIVFDYNLAEYSEKLEKSFGSSDGVL